MRRTLQLEHRQFRTYLIRLVFLLVLYAIMVFGQWISPYVGAAGSYVFQAIVRANFVLITLAAVSWFCTSITEEKEEMTLGLLLMAGVGSLNVISGKHLPRLVSAVLLLSLQYPFVLLAITLGGVTMHQVQAAFLLLLAYMLFVANLGLLISVITPRSNLANSRMVVMLFAYFVGPLLVAFSLAAALRLGWLHHTDFVVRCISPILEFLEETNAWNGLGAVTSTAFSSLRISDVVLANAAAGGLLFLLSWLLFGRLSRIEKPATQSRGLMHINLTPLRRLGSSRAWNRALAWKDFHYLTGGYVMAILKLLLYTGLTVGILVLTQRMAPAKSIDFEHVGVILMLLGITSFLAESAMYALRFFQEEVRWHTLSSLVLLPKSIAQVSYEKLAGCGLALLPATVLTILGVCLCHTELRESSRNFSEPGLWYAFSSYVFWLHVAVLLSLYLRWGVFPMTFLLAIASQIVLFNVLFYVFRNQISEMYTSLAVALLLVCVPLQWKIGRQLKHLAGE